VFPEGTRVRRGPLSTPRRGIGRLALEAGVPVAPVAVIGSENVRRGWRIRPRKVRLRVGRPLSFPTTGSSSPALAAGVTERIWACVSLQWEWLGGDPAPREAVRRAPTTFVRQQRAERAAPMRAEREQHETAAPAGARSEQSGQGEVRAA
jgi:hypothetical protein